MKLTAIDLCCGAGGWIEAARGLPIRFVLAADWDHDCCLTVKYNHPEVPVVRTDVLNIDYHRLAGKVDLVLGAIPCEEISAARASRPADPATLAQWRNLLDGMIEAVSTVGPRYWAVENVVQMRRHLPPLVPQIVLDSAEWSGQKRRRLFLGNFPVPPHGEKKMLADYLEQGPYFLTADVLRSRVRTSRHQWYSRGLKRVLRPSDPAPTITDFSSRHSRGFVVPHSDGRRERYLTFAEGARLQGFPPDYVFVAPLSRASKQVGQAVQIDLARAILTRIVEEHQRSNAA